MNSFRAFIREKGLYMVCLALVFAATITGIWAVRNVVQNVQELSKTKQEQQNKEDAAWNLPDTIVNNPVTDQPEPTPVPSAAPSAAPSSSGASSKAAAAPATSGAGAESSAPAATLSGTPVAGKIIQGFSGTELVYNATLGDWRTHNGTDYAAEAGESVLACKGGKVTAAQADALWGGVVEITDKDGVAWKYCGLAEPTLTVGAQLAAGDTVGTVGKTLPSESKEGTHLHLECTQGTNWLDPVELLK